MDIQEAQLTGEWFNLWGGSNVAVVGMQYGYSQQDIKLAISSLRTIFKPDWVRKNPRHPIVNSLFSPEAQLNFLQVVDLGFAIAAFPRLLRGKRRERIFGELRSFEGFYPREFELRLLSQLNAIVDSILLEEEIPGDPNAPRPDARIELHGKTYDVEIFRKTWSSYGQTALGKLVENGTAVDSNQLTMTELRRLEREVCGRLAKVNESVPMVYVCSPPPHVMVWLALNRTRDKTHVQKVVAEIFQSAYGRLSNRRRAYLQKIVGLAVDMPNLVSGSATPNHKNAPSELICCENPFFD